jgi:hypothetical protein
MEESFKIRSYGFGELAMLYFPNSTKKSASVQFKRWFNYNNKLQLELTEVGFRPGIRILTPKQVEIIVINIGAP